MVAQVAAGRGGGTVVMVVVVASWSRLLLTIEMEKQMQSNVMEISEMSQRHTKATTNRLQLIYCRYFNRKNQGLTFLEHI